VIKDLSAASALPSWDQGNLQEKCGASARARQGAILSRLAHEKSVAPELGKLLEELEPYAANLPFDSSHSQRVPSPGSHQTLRVSEKPLFDTETVNLSAT
jgi:carboxypeptidase Taq